MRAKPPANAAEHARDFARAWADKLDQIAAVRMEQLGIPPERIGVSDYRYGIRWCAFHPFESDGAGISPEGRINIDSGWINPDLMWEPYGNEVGRAWAKSSLRHRLDALIAHEETEFRTGSHIMAVRTAPQTNLSISDAARNLLSQMSEAEKE